MGGHSTGARTIGSSIEMPLLKIVDLLRQWQITIYLFVLFEGGLENIARQYLQIESGAVCVQVRRPSFYFKERCMSYMICDMTKNSTHKLDQIKA